jgi:hypothetical protein
MSTTAAIGSVLAHNKEESLAQRAMCIASTKIALRASSIPSESMPRRSKLSAGESERHYGYTDIAAFRTRRGAVNQARILKNQRVTTFGRDFGVTNTEYQPVGSDKTGRQSQTWIRTDSGWKIVSAHVSYGV